MSRYSKPNCASILPALVRTTALLPFVTAGLFLSSAPAPAGNFCVTSDFVETWAREYRLADAGDRAVQAVRDNAGNLLVVGSAWTGSQPEDIVVLKYDRDGTLVWDRRWDGGSSDWGTGIATDPDGAVYATGRYEVPATAGTEVHRIVIKYDAGGNFQWSRSLGPSNQTDGPGVGVADGLVVVAYDDVVATFYTDGSPGWSRSGNGMVAARVLLDDSLNVYIAGTQNTQFGLATRVVKYGVGGDPSWSRMVDGWGQDWVSDADISSDARVLVGASSLNEFGGLSGTFYCWDRNGNQLWVNSMVDPQYVHLYEFDGEALGASFDAEGSAFLSGRTLNPQHGRALVWKISADGQMFEWFAYGTRGDAVYRAFPDGSGNVIGVGTTGNDFSRKGRILAWSAAGAYRSRLDFTATWASRVTPVGAFLDDTGALFVVSTDDYEPSSLEQIRTLRFDPTPESLTPPELTFGLFRNPYLSQQVRFIIRSSRCMEWMTVELNGAAANGFFDRVNRITYVDYDVTESSPVSLHACGADGYGNSICEDAHYFANLLEGGVFTNAHSADGRLLVRFTPGPGEDGGVLVIADGAMEAGGPTGSFLAAWNVDVGQVLDERPRRVEFSYAGLLPAGVEAEQLYFEGEATGPIRSFVDRDERRLVAVTGVRGVIYVRVSQNPASPVLDPDYLSVGQNMPNPFNPSTRLRFETRASGRVRADVFDVGGRLVATLADAPYEPGAHDLVWNGRDRAGRAAASGVYFCRIRFGSRAEVRRMVLLR